MLAMFLSDIQQDLHTHTDSQQRAAGLMNYPLLPADAAAYAWQLSCCLVTLLFAMFSWMIGPR